MENFDKHREAVTKAVTEKMNELGLNIDSMAERAVETVEKAYGEAANKGSLASVQAQYLRPYNNAASRPYDESLFTEETAARVTTLAEGKKTPPPYTAVTDGVTRTYNAH